MDYLNKAYSIKSKGRKPKAKNKGVDIGFNPSQKELDKAWEEWDGPKTRKNKK